MVALDHLTVADATPPQLIELAAGAGARAVCLFLESMAVLPSMPTFSLVRDADLRRATRARMDDLGVSVDLVYPFTLATRTELEAFRPALEVAAELGAQAVNALVYHRDPGQRVESFGRFCALAMEYGLKVAVELYPPSQVRTLSDALALAASAGAPGGVGVNVDFLHLVRSGGDLAELRAAPAEAILYGQYSDAPPDCDPAYREHEATFQRLFPGEGGLDVAGFARSLPVGVAASVEVPREDLVAAGVPAAQRAREAVKRTLNILIAAHVCEEN
jgi:sugar phosphate isomerase/epimerase